MKLQYRKLTRKERAGSKHKYEVTENYIHQCDLGERHLFIYGKDGKLYVAYDPFTKQLVIFKGYRWDGSTGVIDFLACRRASAVHDALYQLMKEGKLDFKYRDYADQLYRDISIEDGMWRWHANLRYWGLKHFAGKYAKAKNS